VTKGRPRIGICLCGGGITGAIYEVGCLAAIEEAFEDLRVSEFEVIVGASSGSVVAMGLAGGFTAQRLYRALLDPLDDFFPLQRQHLLRFDSAELKRVGLSIFGAARRALASAASRPLDLNVWEEIDRLYDSLPAGLFAMEPFERFLADLMRRRGISCDFHDLPNLMVVANDLDAGERVIFGRDFEADVPVQRAVAASAAAPMLFAPVRIGDRDCVSGGLGAMGHVDIPADAGCELIVVVNAMVPVATNIGERQVPTGHGPMKRVRDKGLLWVNNQAWRVASQARMQQGLAGFRAEHPDVEVLLVEPQRSDANMFMFSPMNFAARRVILEDGYRSTLGEIRREDSPIRRALERRGHRVKAE